MHLHFQLYLCYSQNYVTLRTAVSCSAFAATHVCRCKMIDHEYRLKCALNETNWKKLNIRRSLSSQLTKRIQILHMSVMLEFSATTKQPSHKGDTHIYRNDTKSHGFILRRRHTNSLLSINWITSTFSCWCQSLLMVHCNCSDFISNCFHLKASMIHYFGCTTER